MKITKSRLQQIIKEEVDEGLEDIVRSAGAGAERLKSKATTAVKKALGDPFKLAKTEEDYIDVMKNMIPDSGDTEVSEEDWKKQWEFLKAQFLKSPTTGRYGEDQAEILASLAMGESMGHDPTTPSEWDGYVRMTVFPQISGGSVKKDDLANNPKDKDLVDATLQKALNIVNNNPNNPKLKQDMWDEIARSFGSHWANETLPDLAPGASRIEENKMKITKSQLKQVIKEELKEALGIGDLLKTTKSDELRLKMLDKIHQSAKDTNWFIDNWEPTTREEARKLFMDYVTDQEDGLFTGHHMDYSGVGPMYDDLVKWMEQYPGYFKKELESEKSREYTITDMYRDFKARE